MTQPITLHDAQGRRLFAFHPDTDPLSVLTAVAWAHPHGIGMCNWDCPARNGTYCVECHATAYVALRAARRRFPRVDAT